MTQARDWVAAHAPSMRKLLQTLQARALDQKPLLLVGENGVGKRRLARWVHQKSPLAEKTLVICQLGGEPESTILSVLPEKLTQAKESSLFIDEVDDFPVSAQRMLLQALAHTPVRLIASSSTTLANACQAGRFEKDLLGFLGEEILIPPLRERKEEIPYLISDFLIEAGFSENAITPAVKEIFISYRWPENVRELKHTIIRLLHANDGHKIKPQHLPPQFQKH